MNPHPAQATISDMTVTCFFTQVAFVRIYHLAVFGHHDMRGLVAILSHVVTAKIEGGPAK